MQKIRAIIDRIGDLITVQRVGILFLVLSVLMAVLGYNSQHPEGFDAGLFLADFYANASTELASIAFTALLIDTLTRRRDTRRQERNDREQLIRKLGSKVNEAARQAAEELRAHGWLVDGTLQHADLRAANLENADFYMADVQGANFEWASLIKASLKKSNFVGANLSHCKAWGAKCYKADMRGVNFTNARIYRIDFTKTDLHQAIFKGANIEGANFTEANLRDAVFADAIFITQNAKPDTVTTLPDGSHWTPETDMTRFTNPSHPAFWQPHNMDDNSDQDLGDE